MILIEVGLRGIVIYDVPFPTDRWFIREVGPVVAGGWELLLRKDSRRKAHARN